MSSESREAVMIAEMGCRYFGRDLAEWRGSLDECWNHYVVRHESIRQHPYPVFVYWMTVVAGHNRYAKIGYSQNPEKRFKQLSQSYPIAAWELSRAVRVQDNVMARHCETDMLVSSRHLLVEGEWLRIPE